MLICVALLTADCVQNLYFLYTDTCLEYKVVTIGSRLLFAGKVLNRRVPISDEETGKINPGAMPYSF